jgi:hypothetical protein
LGGDESAYLPNAGVAAFGAFVWAMSRVVQNNVLIEIPLGTALIQADDIFTKLKRGKMRQVFQF